MALFLRENDIYKRSDTLDLNLATVQVMSSMANRHKPQNKFCKPKVAILAV